jgi:hypothetical protein
MACVGFVECVGLVVGFRRRAEITDLWRSWNNQQFAMYRAVVMGLAIAQPGFLL